MSIVAPNAFRGVRSRIWVVYRVSHTGPPEMEDSNSMQPAGRRERVDTSQTPAGARRAAQRDRRRRNGDDDPFGELTWERWGERLVSDRSGNVAYSIELYDVRRN